MSEPTRILYCHCAYSDAVPEDVKRAVLEGLCASGAAFEAVPDLCERAAQGDPALARIAEGGNTCIIACFPRTVKWLFARAGAPLPEQGVDVLNMRTEPAEALLARVPSDGPTAPPRDAAALAQELETAEPDHWIPWFPVLDYDRCVGCRQCLNFCMFGVFALDDEGRVEVRHPENCKNLCPACSRICPEVAIIFPKYPASPINGDEVSEADMAAEKVKVNPRALVQGDVYAKLRQRQQRFAPDRCEAPQGADGTKLCACMTEELQKRLGIPPEVLASLSIDEIRSRLRTAKAAAPAGPQDGEADG